MNGMVLLLALAAPGIDYGWRPGADGRLEYIVQFEPELIDALRNGRELRSDIHPQARAMRRFVLRLGTGQLSREAEEGARRVARLEDGTSSIYAGGVPTAPSGSDPPIRVQTARPTEISDTVPVGVETGWRPMSDGQVEFIVQLDENALRYLELEEEIVGEIAPEVTSVSRLVIRMGDDELPRGGVAQTSATGANVFRTQGPASPNTIAQSRDPRAPAGIRSPPSTTTPSMPPPSGYSVQDRTATAPGRSTNTVSPPTSSPGTRPEFRAGSADSSPQRSSGSPWEASPSRTGGATEGTASAGSGAAAGTGTSSGTSRLPGPGPFGDERANPYPGLLQAPPTDGFSYSMDDALDDEDDQWTTARGIDGGWQRQGPGQDPRYDQEPARSARSPTGEFRQPPPSDVPDPYDEHYDYPEYARTPRFDRGREQRSRDAERYAAAGAPVPRDRVAAASAEAPADRMLSLERDLALERQRALERELEERDRVLASMTARTARRADPETSPSSTRPTAASRAADTEDRPGTTSRDSAARPAADRGGDLLKELILFASLGMNIVAVLIARQYYMRYRMLIREMRDPEPLDD
jgi:hypothetical protein